MVQLKTLFVAALGLGVATCSPVNKRDATQVLADLATVGTSLTTLTNAVNAYTGGLLGAISISTDGTNLDTAINQATADANAATVFTAAESSSVTSTVGSLTPQIQASLTALVNKESLFEAAGVKAIVLSQLNTLQSDSAALGAALQAKSTAADVVTQQGYQSTINASFAFAIAVYS